MDSSRAFPDSRWIIFWLPADTVGGRGQPALVQDRRSAQLLAARRFQGDDERKLTPVGRHSADDLGRGRSRQQSTLAARHFTPCAASTVRIKQSIPRAVIIITIIIPLRKEEAWPVCGSDNETTRRITTSAGPIFLLLRQSDDWLKRIGRLLNI